MKINTFFTNLLLSFVFALSNSVLADTTKPAEAKPYEAQQEVAYADLGKYIGKRITVYTTLGTVRTGTLTKYTNVSIDLKVDGGVELTLPADTIRGASIPVPAPDPAFPGDGSAKKN